ncbi:hypothetical protein HK100_012262 [Physocladia obscura]|uniref:Peptide hydrolase n=1 Tax=Physocladia obscura TaxID=109957 RepID=A0AAD5T2L3_9FUNG|nr:hypothetical protein HK100_012262 [Physocladia obscura]
MADSGNGGGRPRVSFAAEDEGVDAAATDENDNDENNAENNEEDEIRGDTENENESDADADDDDEFGDNYGGSNTAGNNVGNVTVSSNGNSGGAFTAFASGHEVAPLLGGRVRIRRQTQTLASAQSQSVSALVAILAPLFAFALWATLRARFALPLRVLTLQDSIDQGKFAGLEAWRHVEAITNSSHSFNSNANLQVRSYIVESISLFQRLAVERGLPDNYISVSSDSINMTTDDGLIWYESNNVLVKISPVKSAISEKSLLLSAHFDSQTVAKGVVDNGIAVGVALELIRTLIYNPSLEHPLVVNFNNGEELFLLGAGAFTLHPWFKNIAGFVNLDGTGSAPGARSMLLRTNSFELLNEWKKSTPYPHASIIFNNIISKVPSDTDYRVYAGFGTLQGVDVAFYSYRYQYHTPDDSTEYSWPISAQHLGDNVLSAVIGICNSTTLDILEPAVTIQHPITDLLPIPDLVYYDIFSRLVISTGWQFRFVIYSIFIAVIGWTTIKTLRETYRIGSRRFLQRFVRPSGEAFALVLFGFAWIVLTTYAISKLKEFVNPGSSYGMPILNLIWVIAWVFGNLAYLPKIWPIIGEFLLLRKRTVRPSTRVLSQARYFSSNSDTIAGPRVRQTFSNLSIRGGHLQSARQTSRGPPLEKWLPYGLLAFWILLLVPTLFFSLRGYNGLFFVAHWSFYSLVAVAFTEIVSPIALKWWREQWRHTTERSSNGWQYRLIKFYEKQIWGVQLAVSSFLPGLLTIDIIEQFAISLPASFQTARKTLLAEVLLIVFFVPYSFTQSWNISTAQTATTSTVGITFRNGIHAPLAKIAQSLEKVHSSATCNLETKSCSFKNLPQEHLPIVFPASSNNSLAAMKLISLKIDSRREVENGIYELRGEFTGVPGSRVCTLEAGIANSQDDPVFAIYIDPPGSPSLASRWVLEATGKRVDSTKRPGNFSGWNEVTVLRRDFRDGTEDGGMVVPFMVKFSGRGGSDLFDENGRRNLTVGCHLVEEEHAPFWWSLRTGLPAWMIPGAGKFGGVRILKTKFF